ncbi:hypothetical protein TSOC_000593 [Tetrabaena socialis]|uniref:Uncharacterized protein n=1 Tax=Tetrabaena socialis TaxID=47790 RepID=A0A2J8AIW8_9CHLO|nr:hypothetical protein TSOC_000593 [Tetrabaena socialis]|eukprot:PNH12460.1 hypothetical protein TSOC_000593 [Tetrabaena socialis]
MPPSVQVFLFVRPPRQEYGAAAAAAARSEAAAPGLPNGLSGALQRAQGAAPHWALTPGTTYATVSGPSGPWGRTRVKRSPSDPTSTDTSASASSRELALSVTARESCGAGRCSMRAHRPTCNRFSQS